MYRKKNKEGKEEGKEESRQIKSSYKLTENNSPSLH